MLAVREGPVEILTAVAVLIAAVAGLVGAWNARGAKREATGARAQAADAVGEAAALRSEIDPRNGKPAGRVLAEIHKTSEHNKEMLDQGQLMAEVRAGNDLVRKALGRMGSQGSQEGEGG